MASPSVRQLAKETVVRLRPRAAIRCVSMEGEARRMLVQIVPGPERPGDRYPPPAMRLAHGVPAQQRPA